MRYIMPVAFVAILIAGGALRNSQHTRPMPEDLFVSHDSLLDSISRNPMSPTRVDTMRFRTDPETRDVAWRYGWSE